MLGKGFTLVELLIYLTLTTMLLVLVGISVWTMYWTIARKRVSVEYLIEYGCALEVLYRDLNQISRTIFTIKKANSDALVIRSFGKDIGWFQKKNRIMRYQGHYNVISQRWQGVSSSRMVSSGQMRLSYQYDKGICHGIMATFFTDTTRLQRYIPL